MEEKTAENKASETETKECSEEVKHGEAENQITVETAEIYDADLVPQFDVLSKVSSIDHSVAFDLEILFKRKKHDKQSMTKMKVILKEYLYPKW